MAIPSRGIGWATEDNLLWQISKQLERLTQVTGNSVSGSQTLTQTLVIGNNTGGNNILLNNADAIELENTSLLKKGTYNFGGNGGISRICSNNYEDMWQSGIRHVFDYNGFIRNSTNGFDIIPDASFDNTLRFRIGSFWSLDDGTTYECTDATTGAAVWEFYSAPPKYKVFTALLTQSGGSVTYSLQAAPIVVGVTYMIFDSIAGDDFRNVGGPLIVNNNDFNNTYFIATGTTPTNWSGETGLEYNTGTPVATVLENTIGNIWFTYGDVGSYFIDKENNFDGNKTVIFVGPPTWDGGDFYFQSGPDGVSPIFLVSKYLQTLANVNNAFLNTPIEIRVYN